MPNIKDLSNEQLAALANKPAGLSNMSNEELIAIHDGEKAEPSIGETIIDQGLQGLTLGFSDEIGALKDAVLHKLSGGKKDFGKVYDQGHAKRQAELRAQREAHSGISLASNIGGAIANPLNFLLPGAGAVRGLGIVGRAAAEGAVYGAGSSEEQGLGNRLKGAAFGAGAGAAGGLLVKGMGGLISKVRGSKTTPGDMVKKVTDIEKKVFKGDLQLEEADKIANKILETEGLTLKGVVSKLDDENIIQNRALKSTYEKAHQGFDGEAVVPMRDFALKLEEQAAYWSNKMSDVGDELTQMHKKLVSKLDDGKIDEYKTVLEAWDSLKIFGKEAKFNPVTGLPAMQAKAVRRGVMRDIMDTTIAGSDRTLGAALKAINKGVSLNIRTKDMLLKSPLMAKDLTPSAREFIMMGLGGFGKGTMGTLGGIGYASKLVDPLKFASAKLAHQVPAKAATGARQGMANFTKVYSKLAPAGKYLTPKAFIYGRK